MTMASRQGFRETTRRGGSAHAPEAASSATPIASAADASAPAARRIVSEAETDAAIGGPSERAVLIGRLVALVGQVLHAPVELQSGAERVGGAQIDQGVGLQHDVIQVAVEALAGI